MKINRSLVLMLILFLAVACGGGNEEPGNSGGSGGGEPQDIQISTAASRTSGVAPLSVFFNADIDTTNDDFHALEYTWDFGDEQGESWRASGISKNSDKGPVAAHIYETPGVYTATLTIRNASGAIGQSQFIITVGDPEVIYTGDNTVCLSDNTDFSGCPAGAVQVTTSDILDLKDQVDAGKRVLLRRGASWATDGAIYFRNIEGPVTIGAYGSCNSPDERGLCANAPLIHRSDATDQSLFNFYKTTDWRIQDLHLTGDTLRAGATGGATDWRQLLFLRLKMSGFGTPLGNSHWDTDGHDQIMVVDCDIADADSNIIYIGSERLALMGNRLRNASESHVLRVWQAYLGVISHNEISGASCNTDRGRHAIKFHGPSQEVLANAGNGEGGLVHPSRFVMIANNIFGSSGPWPVCVGPQYSGIDERVTDVILEKNRFFSGYGIVSATPVQVSLNLWARRVTVRNNLFDGTGSSRYYAGIQIDRRGIEPAPTGIWIYNNTLYKADVTPGEYTSCEGIIVREAARQTVFVNNLAYLSPTATVVELIRNESPDLTEHHNLLAGGNQWINPDDADFLLKDFRLLPDADALDQGATVSVFDDLAGTPRPQGAAYDLGAYERP